jgi:hypothetical protein
MTSCKTYPCQFLSFRVTLLTLTCRFYEVSFRNRLFVHLLQWCLSFNCSYCHHILGATHRRAPTLRYSWIAFSIFCISLFLVVCVLRAWTHIICCLYIHVAYLQQQCHNSKFVNFQEKSLKVLKCCNFVWVQRRHNCSPAASFANRVMTLYLLKVRLQTFLSIPITQKYQILSCDILVANERYVNSAAILC